MHEKMHERLKINEKERVKWTYRPWERKTLQKIWSKMAKNLVENDKKFAVEPCRVGEREREKFENF